MTNSQMSVRVGIFFALGVILIFVIFESLSKGKLGRDDGYALHTQFRNLKELKAGDEVRMAGVKIGSVAETRLVGRRAEAVLLIDRKFQVAKDSKATIGMAGLLGSNYVALDMGSDDVGFLPEGAQINSVDTPDLNTIVTELGDIGKKVDKALDGLSGAINGKDGAPGIIGKIDRMVDDNQSNIKEVTTNLREITEKVNKGEGTIGRLINDSKVHDELLASVTEIKSAATEAKQFINDAKGIIDQVKSGQGAIGVLLYDKQSGENMKLFAQNLREISTKINSGDGTLAHLINDDKILRQATDVMKKVDRALDTMADSGPISAVGVAGQGLF